MNPSGSEEGGYSFLPSSASQSTPAISNFRSVNNSFAEKINADSKREAYLTSTEADSEKGKSSTDSFENEDISPRNSINVESLISSEHSPAPDSDGYSAFSSTSTGEDQQTLNEGEEIDLTDVSFPPSESSANTINLEPEREDGASLNSEKLSCRNSRESQEDEWDGNDVYETEAERVLNIYPGVGSSLLEKGYDNDEQQISENVRYYSTIIEESDENESTTHSSETLGLQLNMGQYCSINSIGIKTELAKADQRSSGTPSSPCRHSDEWRISQVSTNTNLSTSTGANSDDTLAQNMSELSSINSHLSRIGVTSTDKFILEDFKHIEKDPNSTPIATPMQEKKDKTIKNAINELENIEHAAQTLLMQRQTSSEAKYRIINSANPANNSGEIADVQNVLYDNTMDYSPVSKNILTEEESCNLEKLNHKMTPAVDSVPFFKENKPPLDPSSFPKPAVRKHRPKSKEIKPYISRESYNEKTVLNEIETLRESYTESDLNDFLDKLESSGVRNNMNEETFAQLLADIKADVDYSKQSSNVSLQSFSNVEKKHIRGSKESLSSFCKTKSYANRKFERLKKRILELLNLRKKDKIPEGPSDTNVQSSLTKAYDDQLNGTSRPLTPVPSCDTSQHIAEAAVSSSRSRSQTPDISCTKSPTPNLSKREDKKGFKISNILRMGSPKFGGKSSSIDSKNIKAGCYISKSEFEEQNENKNVNGIGSDGVGSVEDRVNSAKNNSNQDLKKEVRFNLKPETSTALEIGNVNEIHDSNIQKSSDRTPEIPIKQRTYEQNLTLKSDDIPDNLAIPLPVVEINERNERMNEASIRVETLLPKLPERIRPPRRKKRHMIPVTVENISVEGFENSSQKSFEGSSSGSPNISVIIENQCLSEAKKDTLLHLELKLSSETPSSNAEHEDLIAEAFPVASEPKLLRPTILQQDLVFICDTNLMESEANGGVCPEDIKCMENIDLREQSKTKLMKPPIMKLAETGGVCQEDINCMENNDLREQSKTKLLKPSITKLAETEDINIKKQELVHEFEKGSEVSVEVETNVLPSFPVTDDTLPSFPVTDDTLPSFPVTDDTLPSFPVTDDTEVSFYDNVNPYFQLMTKIEEEEDSKVGADKLFVDQQIFPTKPPELNSIEENKSGKKQFLLQPSVRKPSCEEIAAIKDLASNDEIITNTTGSNTHGLNDQCFETINNFINNISFETNKASHKEARRSPALESNYVYKIDELTSLTEEVVRIADDMERDIKVSGVQPLYISPSDKNSNKLQAENVNSCDLNTVSSQTKSCDSKILKIQEVASQTDKEYDKLDIKTHSAAEDVHKPTNHFLNTSSKFSGNKADQTLIDGRTKPPIVPPRHFQQKMPLKVVKELKSVLSDNGKSRSKVPILPPRWDSVLTFNNGRYRNDKSDVGGCSESSSSLSAQLHSNAIQNSGQATDPHCKPVFFSLNSNNVTLTNSVAVSIIKNTKPIPNDKLDHHRSCSLSKENLAPIPEEVVPVSKRVSKISAEPKSFKSAFLNDGRKENKTKEGIFRVRANVYRSFDSFLKIADLQSAVPCSLDIQLSKEDGYQSDPGINVFTPKSTMHSDTGYLSDTGCLTDSEVLSRSKNSVDHGLRKFTQDSNKCLPKNILLRNKGNAAITPLISPTFPEKRFSSNCIFNEVNLEGNLQSYGKSKIKDYLNKNFANLFCDVTPRKNKIKERSHSIDIPLPSEPAAQKHKPVNSFVKQASLDLLPQSITLSGCEAFENHPKELNESAAKLGTLPEGELSYRSHRAKRPLTWCSESDFTPFTRECNSDMVTSASIQEFDENNYKDDANGGIPRSRPSSQLSQRLQVQGLGEWLFLARLDHANQLLSQLTSTMQLQPDGSAGVGSEKPNGENEHITGYSVPPKCKSPPPPPRPPTPIDERDPEQVLSERRFLSYFQGPPRAKHQPGEDPPKEPTFQQIEAQKRYNNYFIGTPQADHTKLHLSSPDFENDEEIIQARRRYSAYFQKGPPRPTSYSETPQEKTEDEETRRAQERYKSYFRSNIPRSRSVDNAERTPEADDVQKSAEQRYMSYFHSGPQRPRSQSNTESSGTREPDEEQIAAEKRYIKYFEGFQKPERKACEEPLPSVTAEMIAAEERFLKYFQPVPHGPPRKIRPPPPLSAEDLKKKELFNEFQMALESRVHRKQMKIIRVSKPKKEREREKTPPTLRDIVVEEFLQKVQDRKKEKDIHFGDTDDEDEDDITKPIPLSLSSQEPIIQGGGTVDKRISTDLQLFVNDDEVWSPGSENSDQKDGPSKIETADLPSFKDVPPVWSPARAGSASPNAGRKEYNKIRFEGSSTLTRKSTSKENVSVPKSEDTFAWKDREIGKRGTGFSSGTSLPRVQSPTVTLLQKRREGQIPGPRPDYFNGEEAFYKPGEKLYTIKREYESEDEEVGSRKFAVLGPKKFEGVGPTTRDGVPIALKSGVKSEHQGEWYRKMFDSLHKVKDDYIVIKYKSPKVRYGGYMSEPDGYDSDYGTSRYLSLDRRNNKFQVDVADAGPRNTKRYVHQPGRIENYVPGFSSLSEKELRDNPEADVKLEIKPDEFSSSAQPSKRHGSGRGQLSHGLKESGYESDSTLVFRKREDQRRKFYDPKYSSVIYRQVQQGGEIPFSGLQKPAPSKPKEPVIGMPPYPSYPRHYEQNSYPDSPYKYSNSEVNIHYRTPVRFEQKEALPEEELARRQADHMKKVYEQERRKKYLAELEDIERRRHTDNFTPLQKSPIPLNRYDDEIFGGPMGVKTPEPKQVARALFNFSAQNKRELSFNKGDLVTIRRPIDRNWYEGELRGSVGIFPCNYVEVIPFDSLRTLGRKPSEGQARTRFNFQAQTAMEMSLTKGEMVILTRRVDENWYEGRVGNRRGIFPVTYVDVLREPDADRPISPSREPFPRPVLPAPHLLYNGTSGVSRPFSSTGRSATDSKSFTQLTVNTQQEPVPYRALYNYKPQNEDELELIEGDLVLVMEKCDDGWFVGTSKRTGLFGTFPGNYVEKS